MTETLEQKARAWGDVVKERRGQISEYHADKLAEVFYEIADALSAMSCPPGWKMVPLEPTDAMWKAGDAALDVYWQNGGRPDSDGPWRAMLSASPTPPAHPMRDEETHDLSGAADTENASKNSVP